MMMILTNFGNFYRFFGAISVTIDYFNCTFSKYILDVKKIFLPNYRAGQYNDAIKKSIVLLLWSLIEIQLEKNVFTDYYFSNPSNEP